jgi:hypothetical protein
MGLDTYVYVMSGTEQSCFERASFELERHGYKHLEPLHACCGPCADDMGARLDGERITGHKHPDHNKYDWIPDGLRVSTAGELGKITYEGISLWNAAVFAFLKGLPSETIVYVKIS